MRFLTDRKRAVGLGSAKTGTAHFWAMKVSSVALLLLLPLFVFTFGPMLGQPHEEVVAYFARPFPAIVAALTLVVGFVRPGGPAAAAGLKVGDTIVAVDGHDVRGDKAPRYRTLTGVPVGTAVTLETEGGETVKITATKQP